MTILLASHLKDTDKPRVDEVRRLLPDWTVLVDPQPAELESHLGDLRIAFGGPSALLAEKAPNLHWYQLGGAGADRIFMKDLHPRFKVTNASGVHAIPIAEHLLAMMLGLGRWLPGALRHQRERSWGRPTSADLFELDGATAVVLGMGAIGGKFAEYARALGMQVIAVRRHPEQGPGPAHQVVGMDRLRDVLPAADHLVITTPLTKETLGLVGAEELALMKPSAYVHNIGRGRIIQEDALIAALEANKLAGAGLDVFEEEPLPGDSPLWDMENVIVTCHYAGLTPRYGQRLWDIFMDNLERYLEGKPLRNLVDPDLGY